MKLTNRIVLATLAGLTGLGGLAATPAFARDSLTIEYRDGYRGRDYDHYRYRRDYRDYRDRRAYRVYDRGYYYGRGRAHCWTEWQWDGWRRERVPVRVCR